MLLRDAGILRASPSEPIVHRDGTPAPWAFYSWNITLGERGLRLAARALLRRLETCSSTQLAGNGYTALPLVAACVLEGGGRYTGLAVRDKAKPYLARRRVDGPLDRRRPVVVVDDSLSSGTSLQKAIRALEADGFEVEGTVVLVHFPYRGGAEWAYRHGYRFQAVFDVWTDLEMAEPAPPEPPRIVPHRRAPRVPAGLPVASAARRAAEIYVTTGMVPKPPDSLADAPDASGGVFVSFRERNSERRLARDGFWRFVPSESDLPEDLVAAAVRAVRSSDGAVNERTLPGLKIGVSCLGRLHRVPPSKLDLDRYGIVVRDATFARKLGGALPNTQVFVSEIEQFDQARFRNAGLAQTEPFELFRHLLTKHVEPGESWLPYGKPDGEELAWADDSATAAAVIARARDLLAAQAGLAGVADRPLSPDVVPYELEGAAVAIYRNGLRARGIADAAGDIEDLLAEAAVQAASMLEPRELREYREAPDAFSVVTTLLHDREDHGVSADLAAWKMRRGLDSVTVAHRGRRSTALPGAVPYNNWSPREVVQTLARNRQGAIWSTCRTTSWLSDARGVHRLRFGFAQRPRLAAADEDPREIAAVLSAYLARNVEANGLPLYHLEPASGASTGPPTAPRLVHGLVALQEAGALLEQPAYVELGLAGLERCLDCVDGSGMLRLSDSVNGAIGDCVLLAGAVGQRELVGHRAIEPLVRRVRGLLRDDGRICEHPVRLDRLQDHDFLPGAVLVALAACSVALGEPVPTTLTNAVRWYRGRFRLLRSWGMAGWQTQGWAAFAELTGSTDQISFVYEVADWAVEHQLEKSGAFLENLSPTEPSFNTGFVAEGIASAWRLAAQAADDARAARYRRSWARALDFIGTLVIRPEDTFAFRDPEQAVGGVRTTMTRSDVRVDAVSHCLQACVSGLRLLDGPVRAPAMASTVRPMADDVGDRR